MLLCTECADCGRACFADAPDTIVRCRFCQAKLPWDGRWTEGLLIELTGGQTRKKGEVTVRLSDPNHVGERVAIERDETRVDWDGRPAFQTIRFDRKKRKWRDIHDAVDWLNDHGACPVNEDGRGVWKVHRKDEDADYLGC